MIDAIGLPAVMFLVGCVVGAIFGGCAFAYGFWFIR